MSDYCGDSESSDGLSSWVEGRGRHGERGRATNDTYDFRRKSLPAHYDITKTPRIEDYLQPRRAGDDYFIGGRPFEHPTSIKDATSPSTYADGKYERKFCSIALESNHHTREEDVLHSYSVAARDDHCKRLGNEKFSTKVNSVEGEYRPYWSYAAKEMSRRGSVPIELPRAAPSTRKSFSELLMESDLNDSSSTKGPLALAAMASVAERVARSPSLGEAYSSAEVSNRSLSSSEQVFFNSEGLQKVSVGMSRINGPEACAKEWSGTQSGASARNDCTNSEGQKGVLISRTTGFFIGDTAEARGKHLWTRSMEKCDGLDACEQPPQSPQPPHTIPLLPATCISSLSDDYKARAGTAVAAFKEGRRHLLLTGRSVLHHPVPKTSSSRSNLSIGNFFRSSRKRSLPLRSRPLRRPLSPVPEAWSLDDELWSKCQADVSQQDLHQLTSKSTGGMSEDQEHSRFNDVSSDTKDPILAADTGSLKSPLSVPSTGSMSFSPFRSKENQHEKKLAVMNQSNATRPSTRKQYASTGGSWGSRTWTVSEENIDLHSSEKGQRNAEINILSCTEMPNLSSETKDVCRSSSSGEWDEGKSLHEKEIEAMMTVRCQKNHEDVDVCSGSFMRFVAQQTVDGSSIEKSPQFQPPIWKQESCERGDEAEGVGNNNRFAVQKVYEAQEDALSSVLSAHHDGCDNVNPIAAQCGGGIFHGNQGCYPSSSSSESSREDDASLRGGDTSSTNEIIMHQVFSVTSTSGHESQLRDETQLKTPLRDIQVAPEVFISPKSINQDLKFTRVLDIEPEERPIFGSLADHWEAAWATKRQAWDGKGIPNSTNKYKEDQKVNWHATPFEERLAQALATQRQVSPRNRFNVPATLATCNDTGLQAH